MPVRIPFTVISCTGEDPDYPCQELQFNAPESRGWCTPRKCQYPQEFSIKLEQQCQLFQIQLLSHEFKIAAKTEISVGIFADGAQDISTVHWKRLGYLSFDSNEQSQLTARELKSVVLNGVSAQLVRFQFLRCHQNHLNKYDQVGLIALNLIGDPLALPLATITNTAPTYPAATLPSLAGLSLHAPSLAPPAWTPPRAAPPPSILPPKSGDRGAGAPAEALASDLNVDVITAQKILELQDLKKKAIDNEDYDEAKRLKAGIDKLKAVGTKIAQLETRKRGAVEAEDYDLAKELKMEVDKLRSAAYSSTFSADALGGEFSNSFISPVPSRRSSVAGAAPAGRRHTSHAEEAEHAMQKPALVGSVPEAVGGRMGAAPRSKTAAQDKWLDYDERPAQAKGVYQFDAAAATAAEPPGSIKAKPGKAAGDLAPKGFPADLPVPEQLKSADVKDAQPVIDLVGDYVARAMFSKTWQLREAALQKISGDIASGTLEGLDGDSDAFKALARSMVRMVKDKVAGVFAAALKVLRELVEHQASRCSTRDVQTVVGELLPLLVEKACDLNARTREQATELLLFLAGVKQAGLAGNTHPVVKPMKSQASGKVVLGRLQLLSTLLPVIGMAGKGGGDGFQLDAVMEFVGAAFGNSNADVRAAAVLLTLQVYDSVGPSVQRFLPADLNPKVKEQIEAGMLNRPAAGAGPIRPAAAAAARPQPPKSAAPSKKAPATGAPAPQTAAPSQPSAPPSAASAYPSSPGSLGMPSPPEDDPALYEAELRSREARLGPAHPDVADALSNLAIIYNQRGDTSRALPLYERALAIWEEACGAEHPDVAHTLTDIAVIHLEQGRDDIGRPLLERALAIQEKHLGPDHPDVVAIRDVLTEEL